MAITQSIPKWRPQSQWGGGWTSLEGEPSEPQWLKVLEYALYPLSITGMSIRGAGKIPGYVQRELKKPYWGLWPSEESPLWGTPETPNFEPILPSGEEHEEYRKLPLWQQLLYESPALIATMAIPTATALRAMAIPRVARVALAPVAAAEQIPGKVIGFASKHTKRIMVGAKEGLQIADTPLPYLNPQLPLNTARKQLKEISYELVDYMGFPKKLPPRVVTAEALKRSKLERAASKVDTFTQRTYRTERMLERLDGYITGGRMWRTFYKPVNDATTNYLRMRDNLFYRLRLTMKGGQKQLRDLIGTKITIEPDVVITASERMGIYLANMNKTNLRHLLFGNFKNVRPMKAKLALLNKILKGMPEEEKTIANWMYDIYQAGTPKIAEVYKQTTGRQLKRVENYIPNYINFKANPTMSGEPAMALADRMRFMQTWATTGIRKGFTRERVAGARQPIELDAISNFMRYAEDTTHYTAMQPVIHNLQSIINNPIFKTRFVAKEGGTKWAVLNQWTKDIASRDPLKVKNQFEKIMRGFRVNAVTAVLGLNVMTCLKQFPSFLSAMPWVGEVQVMRGLAAYISNPMQTAKLIKRYSPQIAHRTFEREIAEMQLTRAMGKRLFGGMTKRELFMFLTLNMDRLAVNSIWRGGFEKYLKKNPAKYQEAANYAEGIIRKTQPFFSVKDIPEFWRSGEIARMFTMFTNQLNQYWNIMIHDTAGKWWAKEIGTVQATRQVIESLLIPALMIGTISRSRPAQSVKEYTMDVASMGAAMFPIFGNFAAALFRGYSQGVSLITTEVIEQAQRVAQRAMKGEWDKVLLSIPELGGYVMGYPVGQPRRTIKAFLDLAEGKTDDLLELIFGQYTREKGRAEPEEFEFIEGGGWTSLE